jgi:signal transduction histidine kinase
MTAARPGARVLSEGVRERAIELLRQRERWLILRVVRYARRRRLFPVLPTNRQPWSEVVGRLSDALASAIASDGSEWTGSCDASIGPGPELAAFCAEEVVRHRARGVELDQFIGFLKCVRSAYLDLFGLAGLAVEDGVVLGRRVLRLFDRIELAMAAEWTRHGSTGLQEELRASLLEIARTKNLYTAVFESTTFPIFVVRDGEGVEAINGLARAFSNRLTDLSDPTGFLALLDSEIPEVRLAMDDGEREFTIRRFPLHDVRGLLSGRVVILIDVTAEHAARRQEGNLRRIVERMRELETVATLAGGMAHEMNNLLQPIVGMTAAVLAGMPKGHRDAEGLELVLEAAGRARDLVGRIMRFSRGDRGRIEAVDAGEEARRTVALLRASLPPGIDLRLDIAEGLPPVLIDRGMLEQCLLNLGINAVHALQGRGGQIDVALSRLDRNDGDFGQAVGGLLEDGIVFAVTDDGPGMSEEVRERCLEPFFTTKPAGEGTGLGLPVVHGMLTAVGGYLAVTSALGQGTSVRGVLPVANRSDRPATPAGFDERR